eukprot:1182719-Rhodomonas_salina.1
MSGTGLAYAAAPCSARSGTGLGAVRYCASVCCYARAMRCPVLAWRIVLRARYAMSGTGLAYAPRSSRQPWPPAVSWYPHVSVRAEATCQYVPRPRVSTCLGHVSVLVEHTLSQYRTPRRRCVAAYATPVPDSAAPARRLIAPYGVSVPHSAKADSSWRMRSTLRRSL